MSYLASYIQSNRPPGTSGKKEAYLSRLTRELQNLITKTQNSFETGPLYLHPLQVEEIATVLVEFAEDVHNDIGIWKSLEKYNLEFFDTPLPFLTEVGESPDKEQINERRIQHLLWVIYPEFIDELVFSPTHPDLILLARTTSEFLKQRFKEIPPKSTVKTFLSQPNRYGWGVKGKLLWLGTKSYLFRNCYRNYLETGGDLSTITITDIFVNSHSTTWSGLGVVDILAALLDISEEQRSTLRSWYQRHTAYYRILGKDRGCLKSLNLINDQLYIIRMAEDASPDEIMDQFKTGDIVFGTLVPWNGEWYWSGEQQSFENMTDESFKKIKGEFLKNYPRLFYPYSPQLAGIARETLKHQYQDFITYHGSDLAKYPDGKTMAADLQKAMLRQLRSIPQKVIQRAEKDYNLKVPTAKQTHPREILESQNGVGVFFNPEGGQEAITGFTIILSGFKKKGVGLSEDEEQAVREFMWEEAVSPQFVRRVVREYGEESTLSAFQLQDNRTNYTLEYLLRRYKGDKYRKTYPLIGLVQP